MPSWKEQSATYLHKAWAKQSFHRVKNVDLSPAQLTPSAEASLRAQLTPPPFIAPEAPGERLELSGDQIQVPDRGGLASKSPTS